MAGPGTTRLKGSSVTGGGPDNTFNQGIKATDWGPLDSGLDALIENAGLSKKTSSGTYSIGVHFHNTGTVAVEAGRLIFSRTTGSTGTLSVANGASFTFNEALLKKVV